MTRDGNINRKNFKRKKRIILMKVQWQEKTRAEKSEKNAKSLKRNNE